MNNLKRILVDSFTGKNLLWQLCAAILTGIIVLSGFDWQYFLFVRGETLNAFFNPALFGGFLIPILLPFVLLIVGLVRNDTQAKVIGWMLAQAAFLGWAISSLYKAFTGRVQPNVLDIIHDSSRNFQFGFLEHGIFWGWPSSHTTVAFSIVFALTTFLGKKYPSVHILAYTYAFYIGIGVSLRIHWFSEFVAGAIIGTVIGVAVGKTWRGTKH
ncbi:MAG: hypothetical protein RIQ41_63 [Candidatus Parcubacteria bacterium]|jgi:membrane-associated phospholipid phosphatase